MKAAKFNQDEGLKVFEIDEGDILGGMQEAVGGYVERVAGGFLEQHGIDVWCNDERRLRDLPYSLTIAANGYLIDIFGTVLFTRADGRGETVTLSDEDVSLLGECLS